MRSASILTSALRRRGLTRMEIRNLLQTAGAAVSRQRIHAWLSGSAVPAAEILPHLCDILKLNAHEAASLYEASKIPLPAVLRPPAPISQAA